MRWPPRLVDLAQRLMAGPRAPEIPAGAALAGAVLRVGLNLLEEVEAAAAELPAAPRRRLADPADLAALRPGDYLVFGSSDGTPSDLADFAAFAVSCTLWEGREFRNYVAHLSAPSLCEDTVDNLACYLVDSPHLEALAVRAGAWPLWQARRGRPPGTGRIPRPARSPGEARKRLAQARTLLRAARLLLAAAKAATGPRRPKGA
jgi:hypothetical protein